MEKRADIAEGVTPPEGQEGSRAKLASEDEYRRRFGPVTGPIVREEDKRFLDGLEDHPTTRLTGAAEEQARKPADK